MTEHNYGDFCNQKQASTKNVNANLTGSLYGATFFSSLASLARYLRHLLNVLYNQAQAQKGTSRQRSGKGAIRKRFPLQKTRWEKTN